MARTITDPTTAPPLASAHNVAKADADSPQRAPQGPRTTHASAQGMLLTMDMTGRHHMGPGRAPCGEALLHNDH
ncbi:hypothetical protein [Streptomyces sp. NBC_01435]|uniref:hypothetical protein n=1 Tax=Streptomyces sp. NBC_01435 TaxID=2903865 RepID=UPI002E339A94|nr:hypothetical protein [Streptomyces sp. NBC_01435]